MLHQGNSILNGEVCFLFGLDFSSLSKEDEKFLTEVFAQLTDEGTDDSKRRELVRAALLDSNAFTGTFFAGRVLRFFCSSQRGNILHGFVIVVPCVRFSWLFAKGKYL